MKDITKFSIHYIVSNHLTELANDISNIKSATVPYRISDVIKTMKWTLGVNVDKRKRKQENIRREGVIANSQPKEHKDINCLFITRDLILD